VVDGAPLAGFAHAIAGFGVSNNDVLSRQAVAYGAAVAVQESRRCVVRVEWDLPLFTQNAHLAKRALSDITVLKVPWCAFGYTLIAIRSRQQVGVSRFRQNAPSGLVSARRALLRLRSAATQAGKSTLCADLASLDNKLAIPTTVSAAFFVEAQQFSTIASFAGSGIVTHRAAVEARFTHWCNL